MRQRRNGAVAPAAVPLENDAQGRWSALRCVALVLAILALALASFRAVASAKAALNAAEAVAGAAVVDAIEARADAIEARADAAAAEAALADAEAAALASAAAAAEAQAAAAAALIRAESPDEGKRTAQQAFAAAEQWRQEQMFALYANMTDADWDTAARWKSYAHPDAPERILCGLRASAAAAR